MNPRPAVPRRRPTREQTREQVLRAALELFSQRGYERASLDDIAAAAGLTKGAIYSSFGSKEQLFFEVLKVRTDARLAGARAAADGASLGEHLERFTADDPTWHLAFIEFWASIVRSESTHASEFAERRRALRHAIAGQLRETRNETDDAIDDEQLAVIILALSNGLAIEQAINPEHTAGAAAAALSKLLKVPQPCTGLS